MKIAILAPKSEFTKGQQKQLAGLGSIVYTQTRAEYSVRELTKLALGAEILGVDPDNLGGFEKASDRLKLLLESLRALKGIALSTTSYGWVDLEYCHKRKISVCNVPGYSRESVAEHSLALLLCLAKRIIEVDRKTRQGKYELVMGTELSGKTLGILGLGSIGSRMAELGSAIGMKVIAYNRTPKDQPELTMKTLGQVIRESDALSIHLRDTGMLSQIINKSLIKQMKQGVMIVNTADRELVDESAMAKALRSGKVWGYAYEGEDLENTPLMGIDTAIGIKGFGWYTKEALANLHTIWVENITSIASEKPQNKVEAD